MRVKAFGAAAAIVLAAMVGVGAPASASTQQPRDFQDCWVDGTVCFWSQNGYNGGMVMADAVPSGQCTNMGIYGNSYYNRSSRPQRIWEGQDCTGRNVLVSPGWGDPYPPWTALSVGGV
ncbi:peptidase inhibitor family I36 protein [Flindersiella endophytica]